MSCFAAIVVAASVVGQPPQVAVPQEILKQLEYFVGDWNMKAEVGDGLWESGRSQPRGMVWIN